MKNKFSKVLAELLRENEVSQSLLAGELNMKQQTVSRYVSGEREPDIDTIIAIARFFDVSTDYLFGLED